VRVMHHVADVEGALAEIRRVIRPGGTFLLEFANKRHLKAIARYLARRQEWNPFDPAPVEFVSLNYDFHPRWMRARLQEQGFDIQRTRTVSHFRVPLLKRLIPARALAALDGAVQWTGQWWMLTPSIFMRAAKPREASSGPLPGDDPLSLFRCPACTGQRWREAGSELRCGACGARWAIDDGIYDFKDAI
jgi:SAM-dependent methyltransferase